MMPGKDIGINNIFIVMEHQVFIFKFYAKIHNIY